ncbi:MULTISPECIES: carboxymuconolactone decarboxylase family protein [unclassified Burkholderia]|uniref:carboxymuconolactone decarboxylase family protein n=1 Tax=unclassified Burkholderia TaxID=2613784 RepID=UPI002AB22761|nr:MULTISPECIES: carboxymuconolactone decarboxylase family protein [unclassified Burkholderia]
MSEKQDWPALLTHIGDALPRFQRVNPSTFKAFVNVLEVNHNLTEIDAKTRELIAVAVAAAIHCDGCIAYHVHEAKKAGATIKEVGAALATAMTIGMGSKFIQTTYAMDAYEQLGT